jgi:putative Mn2+ efflux pump MntP
MSVIEMILLSVALAMDCFTVSVINGVLIRRMAWAVMARTAFLFGLFQALMPLLGWVLTSRAARYIEAYDHWVAFGLLAYLGIGMLREADRPMEEHDFDPRYLKTQLTQAVATSIDALAVGISMAVMGYERMEQMILPLFIIGIGSLLLSVTGFLLGINFGTNIRRRLQPERVGGIILIGIGLRILVSHLLEN